MPTRTHTYHLLVPWPSQHWGVHIGQKLKTEQNGVMSLVLQYLQELWTGRISYYGLSSLGTETPDPAPCWLLQKRLLYCRKSGEWSNEAYKCPTPSTSLCQTHCTVACCLGKRWRESVCTCSPPALSAENPPFDWEMQMYFKLLLPWLNGLYRSIVSVAPQGDHLLSNTRYTPADKAGRKKPLWNFSFGREMSAAFCLRLT